MPLARFRLQTYWAWGLSRSSVFAGEKVGLSRIEVFADVTVCSVGHLTANSTRFLLDLRNRQYLETRCLSMRDPLCNLFLEKVG